MWESEILVEEVETPNGRAYWWSACIRDMTRDDVTDGFSSILREGLSATAEDARRDGICESLATLAMVRDFGFTTPR